MSLKLLFLIFIFNSTVSLYGQEKKTELTEILKLDEKSLSVIDKQYKLNDPFVIQIFSAWRTKAFHNNKFNEWMDLFLSGKLELALKGYSQIQSDCPKIFAQEFALIEFYLFDKLNLSQVFFDRWIPYYLKNKNEHPLVAFYDQILSMQADVWLYDHKPFVSDEMKELLNKNKLDPSRFILMSNIWKDRKDKTKVLEHLSLLPLGSPLKTEVGFRAVYFLAKEDKLAEAGRILKTQVWPEVKNSGDPLLLANYYMTIARLLYQAGADQAALEFYQKIPNSLDLYLDAQAEISWIYLRLGEFEKAQAISRKLSSKAVDDFFNPEFYLVESISDLKRCRFSEVKSNLNNFSKENQAWLKKASNYSFKSSLEQKTLDLMKKKLALQKNLLNEYNITGNKVDDYLAKLELQTMQQKKRMASLHLQIIEKAYFKMRFVKIAHLSYRDALARNKAPKQSDKISLINSATSKNNSLIFPKDEVYWPDEVMAEEVQVQDLCIKK